VHAIAGSWCPTGLLTNIGRQWEREKEVDREKAEADAGIRTYK
jgi:hypothetical protein